MLWVAITAIGILKSYIIEKTIVEIYKNVGKIRKNSH